MAFIDGQFTFDEPSGIIIYDELGYPLFPTFDFDVVRCWVRLYKSCNPSVQENKIDRSILDPFVEEKRKVGYRAIKVRLIVTGKEEVH